MKDVLESEMPGLKRRVHQEKRLEREVVGKVLTESSEFRNTSSVTKKPRTLQWLIRELKRLTEPSGMKAKLAEYLKVPPARVSEWLSEKYIPSGDMTLRMLNWVENPEERK